MKTLIGESYISNRNIVIDGILFAVKGERLIITETGSTDNEYQRVISRTRGEFKTETRFLIYEDEFIRLGCKAAPINTEE